MSKKPVELPTAEPVPDRAYPISFREHVNGNLSRNCRPISEKPYLAWGAFGVERLFWELAGVFSTAVAMREVNKNQVMKMCVAEQPYRGCSGFL